VFVSGKPFQPSQKRNLPKCGGLERCFTQIGSIFTRKNYTRLERLEKDKALAYLAHLKDRKKIVK
jgi:hypothetical protein